MHPSPPAQPQSPRDLFFSFTWLALQGFGGVLAIVQREMVEKKKWLTPEQFLEDWAVAQVMPGPNVINLALMIGDRYFGLRGALAAVAGMLAIPLVVILALAVLYSLTGEESDTLRAVLAVSALFQGTAIILNLLPLPGLDGYGILQPWLPEPVRRFADPLAGHVSLILAGLFLFSGAFGPVVFRVSLLLIGLLGIEIVDARDGYGLIRLW